MTRVRRFYGHEGQSPTGLAPVLAEVHPGETPDLTPEGASDASALIAGEGTEEERDLYQALVAEGLTDPEARELVWPSEDRSEGIDAETGSESFEEWSADVEHTPADESVAADEPDEPADEIVGASETGSEPADEVEPEVEVVGDPEPEVEKPAEKPAETPKPKRSRAKAQTVTED